MRKITVLLLASCALRLTARADFDRANKEFSTGNYKGAIVDYQAEVAAHRWSANLFYDLGNAYYRVNDIGRAILNYKRALVLDPRHPEPATNLQIARDQSRGLELTPAAAETWLGTLRSSTWAIAAAVCFWLGIFALFLPRTSATVAGAIFCFVLSAGCVYSVWSLESGTQGARSAVVVSDNAEARVATADSARSILALPPGSEVMILQERGDWNYAELPNHQRGWIAANAGEKVRL
ncbi:MAG: tetratricopeptide repeat protein [Verrucomicrobia bacterium]|nr:tetratricopeptide repeat protein [Verrucomicrobiota bacterium]